MRALPGVRGDLLLTPRPLPDAPTGDADGADGDPARAPLPIPDTSGINPATVCYLDLAAIDRDARALAHGDGSPDRDDGTDRDGIPDADR